MRTETLTVENETVYDSISSSEREEVKFNQFSCFLQPSSDNLVTDEFRLRKSWFGIRWVSSNKDSTSLTKPVSSMGSSAFPSFWVEWNTWDMLRRRHAHLLSQQFFTIDKVSSPSVQIPPEITQIADDSALNLLSDEVTLVPYTANLLQSFVTMAARLNLSATCSLTTFADPESNEKGGLVLDVKIHNRTYTEILSIWDEVAIELLSNLPMEIQKKITLVFDEA